MTTEHILSLRYGKDSLACLGAIEQLGWPLDSYPGSEWVGDLTYHCIRCSECYLRTCDYKSPKKADEAWNRRANNDNGDL